MKNFFMAILFCAFSCKSMGAMLKTHHKPVQQIATPSLLTPKNFCIAVGLTAGGWYVYKLYQRQLENEKRKEEEMRLIMLQAKFFDAWGQGNAGEVEECIKAGASLRICNTDGQTPLIVSTIQNDVAMVKLFLQYDPESCLLCDNQIKYAYDYAVAMERKEIVTALKTAANKILYTIISTGKETAIAHIRGAVAAGADVNVNNDAGAPLLMVAILNENMDLVKKLIQEGADTQAKDLFGNTIEDILSAFDNNELQLEIINQAVAEREFWKKTVEAENAT